jgi:hypothetical protein
MVTVELVKVLSLTKDSGVDTGCKFGIFTPWIPPRIVTKVESTIRIC